MGSVRLYGLTLQRPNPDLISAQLIDKSGFESISWERLRASARPSSSSARTDGRISKLSAGLLITSTLVFANEVSRECDA